MERELANQVRASLRLARPVPDVGMDTGAAPSAPPPEALVPGQEAPEAPEGSRAVPAQGADAQGLRDFADKPMVDNGGPITNSFGTDLTGGGTIGRDEALQAQQNEQQAFASGRGFAPTGPELEATENQGISGGGGKPNAYGQASGSSEQNSLSTPVGQAMGESTRENRADALSRGNEGPETSKNPAYSDAYGSGLTQQQHEDINNAVFPSGYGTGTGQWTDSSMAGLGKGTDATSSGTPRSTLDGVHGTGGIDNDTRNTMAPAAPSGVSGPNTPAKTQTPSGVGDAMSGLAGGTVNPSTATSLAGGGTSSGSQPKNVGDALQDLTTPLGGSASKMGQRREAWSGWGPGLPASDSSFGGIQPIGSPFGTFPGFGKPPQQHHAAAGWDWDDYQNGYIASQHVAFTCDCGEQHPPPPSYRTCGCGKIWNSYPIGAGDDFHTAQIEQYVCREIPVRPGVIVANRRMARSAEEVLKERFDHGNESYDPDEPCPYCHQTEGHHARECPLYTAPPHGLMDHLFHRGQHTAMNWHVPPNQGAVSMELARGPGWLAAVHPNGSWQITREGDASVLRRGRAGGPVEAKGMIENLLGNAHAPRAATVQRLAEEFGVRTKYHDYSTKELTKLRQHSLTDPHSRIDPVELNRELSKRELISRLATLHDVTEPGELGEGRKPRRKPKTFREQPPDWARRDAEGKWYHGDGHEGRRLESVR